MTALNRLLLWQKFALLALIGLLLVAVPLTLFIKESRISVNAAALEASGLAPARAVLSVVTLIQQHRGMSAMRLNGSDEIEAQRTAKQRQVNEAFSAAAAEIAAIGDERISQLWEKANRSWEPLHQQVAQRTITGPKSFEVHTALITDLLNANTLIIDRYGFGLDPDPAAHQLINVALMQSPQLTETLGRMRAKGAGMLTAGSAVLQDRATMIGMQTRANELYASIESASTKAFASAPALEAKLVKPLRDTLALGRETMQLTNTEIILPETFTYAGAAYFAKTTEAIGAQLALYDAAVAELGTLLDERQSALLTHERVLIGAVLFLATLAAWLGVLITRSITRPIEEAIGYAQRIAKGDLSADIVVTSNNELGHLLQALKDMNTSLVKIVSEVRAGTDTIASASGQIASANMDLSARTEEQAGALEETASSMEEVTGSVKQTADSAREANGLARNASEAASRGGDMVHQVVATMGAIDASSRKVADIISVINSIAFQTNILALNAAVEAARAGEQGRGFAVVATEVRSLAQRSANAAKEIEGLIKDSVERAAAGARLAGETGAAMGDIVTSIRKVSDIIGEIANASEEQSTGIVQVNQAVTEMDATTQQNAALVEQAAAAAESLKDQADDLAELVSVFKLAAGDAPHRFAHGLHPAQPPVLGLVQNRPGMAGTARLAGPSRRAA